MLWSVMTSLQQGRPVFLVGYHKDWSTTFWIQLIADTWTLKKKKMKKKRRRKKKNKNKKKNNNKDKKNKNKNKEKEKRKRNMSSMFPESN